MSWSSGAATSTASQVATVNKIMPDSFVTLSKAKVCRINSNLHIRENFEVLFTFQFSSSCCRMWCCGCYMCPMRNHMLYQSSDQILGEIQLRWRYFSHLSKRFLELIISTTHERVVSQLRALFSVVSIYTYSDFIKRTERITSHSHRRSIDVGRLAVDIRRSHSVVLIFFLYIFL